MFTGLFRRRDSDINSSTPLEALRQRQTESLKKHNPAVVEIQKYIDYRLNLTTNLGTLTVNIYLPPQFPQSKPVISVSPAVRHPWVNEQQQLVGCPELFNFSMHSDLGKLVQNITEEFQRHPPVTLSLPYCGLAAQLPYPVSPPSDTSHSSTAALTNAVYTPGSGKSILHLPFPQGSYTYDATPLPSSFPELKELSLTELQELKDDHDRLQDFIEKLPVMQKITKEREDVSEINEALANENLSNQPILEDHKKKLLEMIDTVSSLRQQYDEHSHQQQVLSEQYSPSSIQENLKFAALQAEEESESIAENFLEGKMEIEEFLSKFTEKRILSHCRRAKEEKLHQQLMELKKSGF